MIPVPARLKAVPFQGLPIHYFRWIDGGDVRGTLISWALCVQCLLVGVGRRSLKSSGQGSGTRRLGAHACPCKVFRKRDLDDELTPFK